MSATLPPDVLKSSEFANSVGSLVDSQNTQFHQSTRAIKQVRDSMGKRRPPVQPESDIAKEQQSIQKIVQKNALFIQVVLFLVLLCAISYLLFPLEMANVVSLFVLGSAVIYRIFFVQ
jgi:hypothetical protein